MNRTYGIALLLAGLIVGLSIGAVVAPKPLPSKPETYQVTAQALLIQTAVLHNVTAACNSGDKVISGGFELTYPFNFPGGVSREDIVRRVHILANRATPDGTGWLVTGFQEGLSSITQHIPLMKVTAVCVVLHK